MTIASRTPEGDPHQCPICGEFSALEPSFPGGDSCCPTCGQLLWWFRDNYDRLGFDSPERVTLDRSLFLAEDSLDVVEIVMELEEKFDVSIRDEDASKFRTIADAVRYIRFHRRR